MKLEVLMSCMHQKDDSLIRTSGLTGDAVMINQCDQNSYREYPTEHGTVRIYSCKERGLTKSRNMAIRKACADVCLLCDDDEHFLPEYEQTILNAYALLPDADIIIFKMANMPAKFKDKVMRLRFPQTMHISSWQISFRRERLLNSGVFFDELLGAGTGNGAEEELKFLLDCQRAGLRIFYVPVEIATVEQNFSTWFHGFTEDFFENRGATTRYILGLPLSCLYAIYYVIAKHRLYCCDISSRKAFSAIFRGILENKITRQALIQNKLVSGRRLP